MQAAVQNSQRRGVTSLTRLVLGYGPAQAARQACLGGSCCRELPSTEPVSTEPCTQQWGWLRTVRAGLLPVPGGLFWRLFCSLPGGLPGEPLWRLFCSLPGGLPGDPLCWPLRSLLFGRALLGELLGGLPERACSAFWPVDGGVPGGELPGGLFVRACWLFWEDGGGLLGGGLAGGLFGGLDERCCVLDGGLLGGLFERGGLFGGELFGGLLGGLLERVCALFWFEEGGLLGGGLLGGLLGGLYDRGGELLGGLLGGLYDRGELFGGLFDCWFDLSLF